MRIIFICIICFAFNAKPLFAQQETAISGLSYDTSIQDPVPIPPSERMLQSVIAKPYFKVTDEGNSLEGAIFDQHGNLLFCDVTGRRVLCLTPEMNLSTIITFEDLSPGGLALNGEGCLFIAAINLATNKGGIFSVNTDGTGINTIIDPEAGYIPNDLVFNSQGGFYFTDFKGTSTEPKGGVYYVSPDFSSVSLLTPNLAMANGIALSPDEKTLWITEFSRNLLHRVLLTNITTISSIGSTIAYHFTGTAPDSMRSDIDGNVYVAIYGQGRILAFNENGIPIGQVLLAGRENGHHLLSTSLAIHPDKNVLYAVTSDGSGGLGATVFQAEVFAKGLSPIYSK